MRLAVVLGVLGVLAGCGTARSDVKCTGHLERINLSGALPASAQPSAGPPAAKPAVAVSPRAR